MGKLLLAGVFALSLLGGGISLFSPATRLASTAPVGMAAAIVPATAGCPLFHCTPEATGVMYQPIVQGPVTATGTNALGKLAAQGCAGDGVKVACLFTSDKVTGGLMKGTLKLLDASTLAPIWGSAGVAELYGTSSTYDIASSFSVGEVPLLFSDGTIAAGDGIFHVLYDSAGRALKKVSLDGAGENMGLTPISEQYGVVSQSDGRLTLIDLNAWTKSGPPLSLTVGTTTVSLVSPSSGSAGVLYAVATNKSSGMGYLFSIVMSTTTGTTTLKVRGVYSFLGTSSASPVIVKPSISGFSNNLVLIHVPGLVSDGGSPKNRLMGLIDNKGTWKQAWSKPIELTQELGVAPTIDEVSKSLYFQYHLKPLLYRYSFITGSSTNTYNIQTLGKLPSGFKLNGHIVSVRTGDSYTILLSGFVNSIFASQGGQYVVALKPGDTAGSGTVIWKPRISPSSDMYTAAWTLGPSKTIGIFCPIVVGTGSGITKICD